MLPALWLFTTCTLVGEALPVEHVFDEYQEHPMAPFRGPQGLAYALARGTPPLTGLLTSSTGSRSPPIRNA